MNWNLILAGALIAFMNARINEDEASEWPHRPGCQMLKKPPTGFPFDNYSCNCDAATRWLREVEVKRAILDRIVPGIDHLHGYIEISYADDPQLQAVDLLKILALPYAGHPDYCEAIGGGASLSLEAHA